MQNKQTCINHVWVIDFNKFNGLQKIIKRENIEISDIIPNFGENTENSQGNKYFLQDVVSWAKFKNNNPIRLITHFAYLESLGRLMGNRNLEKQKLNNIVNPKKDFSEFDNFLKELKNDAELADIKKKKKLKTN